MASLIEFEQTDLLWQSAYTQSLSLDFELSASNLTNLSSSSARQQYWFNPSLALRDFGVASGWGSQAIFQRHIGDVNGDGRTDVVGIGYDGVLLSSGFAYPRLASKEYQPSADVTTVLADVNGDGRDDLIDFSSEGMSVAYGQTDATFTKRVFALADFGQLQGWSTQQETLRLAGDVNGDGKADIIGFGYAGALVALSTGGPGLNAFEEPILGLADFGIDQGWDNGDLYHRAIGDVNGDGLDDIVGFGDEGVSVALSKGDGTFDPMVFALDDFGLDQGWSTQDEFTRLVGDINRDGRADIVGFGIAGVYVAYGQADGTFSASHLDYTQNFTAAQGWTSNDLYPRELMDFGHVVGFGYHGVYILSNYNGFPPG